jgi:hypothetical protein
MDMATKRRLTDMYRVQKEVVFDDGQGEPIAVLVRKMNPVDHQNALRHANAARARTAALKNHPEDDEYQSQFAQVVDYDRDELTRYLLEEHRLTRVPVVEAELADEEEWSKDGYLDGLKHAWMDGLKDQYALDPEDTEGKRVLSELERFQNKVDEFIQVELDNLEDTLDKRTEDDLRKTVFEKLMTTQASIAWLQEYRRCEVAYGTRTEDGKERYFANRDEVSELPVEIYSKLTETYQEISVPVDEGKDLPETEASSPSSAQPESQATESDSGQQDA